MCQTASYACLIIFLTHVFTVLRFFDPHFLISEHLLNDINNCIIQSGFHSDHSILKLDLYTDKRNRGRGFLKFNSDLLHDKDYVHLIKKTISDCKRNLHKYTNKGLVW